MKIGNCVKWREMNNNSKSGCDVRGYSKDEAVWSQVGIKISSPSTYFPRCNRKVGFSWEKILYDDDCTVAESFMSTIFILKDIRWARSIFPFFRSWDFGFWKQRSSPFCVVLWPISFISTIKIYSRYLSFCYRHLHFVSYRYRHRRTDRWRRT